MTLLIGCASPEQIALAPTEYIEIARDVIVSVPEELTTPIAIPQLDIPLSTKSLGGKYRETVAALMTANNRLAEIATLGLAK